MQHRFRPDSKSVSGDSRLSGTGSRPAVAPERTSVFLRDGEAIWRSGRASSFGKTHSPNHPVSALHSPLCSYKHILKNSGARVVVPESFRTISPFDGDGVFGNSCRYLKEVVTGRRSSV